MVPLVLSFVIGLLLCCQLAVLPPLYWVLAGILLASGCWYRHYRMFAALLAGFCWAALQGTLILQQSLPDSLEGRDVLITGQIDDVPVRFAGGVRFNFQVDEVVSPEGARIPERIRLAWYSPRQEVKSGQTWQLQIRLKKPHGSMNPGTFDFEQWLFLSQIRGTGYVRNAPDINRLVENRGWLRPLMHFRQTLSDFFDQQHSLDYAPFYKALTLGEKSDIDASQWQVLRKTGTTHLMAISGLHIGLVAALVFFLVRWLWPLLLIQRWPALHAAALAAMLAAMGYAAIAGFSVPTQRALVMVCVVMGGLMLRRVVRPLNILALAMLLVTLYDPFAVLSAGFWLSFFAVALIGYVSYGRLSKPSYWVGLTRLQGVIAIGILPILLFYFQDAPLLGPLVNLLAIPVFSFFLVPVTLFAALLAVWWPDAAVFIYQLADLVMGPLWQVMSWASDLPVAHFTRGAVPFWSLLLALLGALLWFAPRGFPCRFLSLFFWLPVFFVAHKTPAQGSAWFTLLDVGQGLAAVIQTREHVLVYDTGPRYSERYDMGRSVLMPFLRSSGISSIDLLMLSHSDNDHSGGARSVLEEFPVAEVSSSYEFLPGDKPLQRCQAGQKWRWDGVWFEVLSPQPLTPEGDNNQSCVLKVTALGGAVLLPGDIESASEAVLVSQLGSQLDSEILVLPHHGSATSSTEAFLRAVDPDYALVSAGYRNRYRLPAQKLIKALRQQGIVVLNTAEEGALQFRISQGDLIRQPAFRESAGRFWHQRPAELFSR